jgi:hypothetical protein
MASRTGHAGPLIPRERIMAISSIGSVSAATVRTAPVSTAAPKTSALATAQEEANESAQTTRQEAAKGDQVAISKLARQQQTQQSSSVQRPAFPPPEQAAARQQSSTAQADTQPQIRDETGRLNTAA